LYLYFGALVAVGVVAVPFVPFSRGWRLKPFLAGLFRSRAERALVAVGLTNRD
jgi:hypothetical protein